jgi:hypothetical protein
MKIWIVETYRLNKWIVASSFIEGELFVSPISYTEVAGGENMTLYVNRYPTTQFRIRLYKRGK